jgi:CDP-glucose 4,6-dehydratase
MERTDDTSPHGRAVAGQSVFVTGAYGFVGGWLTRALLERGARVSVLRRAARPGCVLELEGLERECEVIEGDILDAGLLDRALTAGRFEGVLHLAGASTAGAGDEAPLRTFEKNVRGTWNLLEALGGGDVGWVVVASTAAAYGPAERPPLSESAQILPRRAYEASKAAADVIARSYWTSYGLPVATARFGNVYGAGDRNRSRLVPSAIAALLAGAAPVIRSDGSPERDFLHVDDAVAACLALAGALAGGPACGQAFNVGGGEPHRLIDVVTKLCELSGTGLRPEVQGVAVPGAEADRTWLDSSKLGELTGWGPRIELADGLARTLDWHREHPASLAA